VAAKEHAREARDREREREVKRLQDELLLVQHREQQRERIQVGE